MDFPQSNYSLQWSPMESKSLIMIDFSSIYYNGLQWMSSNYLHIHLPLVSNSTAYGLQWSLANILRSLASGLKIHYLWTTMDSSQHHHISCLWSQTPPPMDYNGLQPTSSHLMPLVSNYTIYGLQWTPANILTSRVSGLKLHCLWTTMDYIINHNGLQWISKVYPHIISPNCQLQWTAMEFKSLIDFFCNYNGLQCLSSNCLQGREPWD